MENEVKQEAKNKKVFKRVLKKVKKVDKKIWWITLSILIVLICFMGVVGLGSYRLGWDNGLTNFMVKTVPYPAAIVNGEIVTLYDWKFEVKAVDQLKVKQLGQTDTKATELEVMEKLINDKILRRLARKMDIKVSDQEMNDRWQTLIDQVGDEETLVNNIKDFFSWEPAEFKERVVYTDILREKMQTSITESESMQADVEKQAQKVLSEVNKGKKTFEELAKEYSADPGSGQNGGDLGWFPRGVMVTEFEDAVFALEIGQTSELIQTQFGYHIILLKDKKVADPAADGKEAGEEQVFASHILIAAPNFQDLLKEYEEKAFIYKFVAVD
jgi:foldase protein PrsA